jgi:3-oxoacyl-[acyl-carrier-protein] synthase-3
VIARADGDRRIGITGVGAYVPEHVVENAELARRIGGSGQEIFELTGIRERRIAAPQEAASDLAVPASLAALRHADVDPASIDLVIVATSSPDLPLPATAAIVASAIGTGGAAAYDVAAACTGFVYALAQAYAAVAAGLSRHALVIGAETLSRITSWDDRETCILFGDGAGAAVIEEVADGGFVGFELGCDGGRVDDLLIAAGGSRRPASGETVAQGEHTIRMKGREVFRFSTRVTVDSTRALLDGCGLTVEDVDLYVPHQANRRIIEHAARRLGLPSDKILMNIDRYGNTSAASIPLALAEAVGDGRLGAGATVLITGVGAGMTWGAALVRWTGPAR